MSHNQKQKEEQMRKGWLVFVLMLLIVGVMPNPVGAQENMDSIWVNIIGADEGKDEEGKLQVVLTWEVFKKVYNQRKMSYGYWEAVGDPKDMGLTFRPEVALDSAFVNIAQQVETQELSYTFNSLRFDYYYYWRVELVSPDMPNKWNIAEGILYKHTTAITYRTKMWKDIMHLITKSGVFGWLAILMEIAFIIIWFVYAFRGKKRLMPLLIGLAFAIFAMGFWGVGAGIGNVFESAKEAIDTNPNMQLTQFYPWLYSGIFLSCYIMVITGFLSTLNGLLLGLGAVLGKKSAKYSIDKTIDEA